METKLTCPVCDRQEIEGNICPNCETNLSLVRMLAELPSKADISQQRGIINWLPWGMALLLLLAGISLGIAGNYWLLPPTSPMAQTSSLVAPPNPNPSPISPQPEEGEKPQPLRVFEYTVRSGDSLSLIAYRFYGESNFQNLITQCNPQLKGREDLLNIGEIILVPNLKESCSSMKLEPAAKN